MNHSPWRSNIHILDMLIPLNNCSHAPQTDATRAAAQRYLDSWNTHGMDWEAWLGEVQQAKAAFARLINAAVDEIALFGSVSEAASALASAHDFTGERSTVVVSDFEFPTISHVWLAQQRRGARVTWAADAIDGRTAIVSAPHAYYLNGALLDIGAIARRAHEHGARIFVDAYQSLGVAPLDVKALDIDYLASGNQKYLLGIPGIAFLYVRRELIESLEPTMTGWFGRVNPFAFDPRTLDWAPSAARFELGTAPIVNAYVARAGMELILEIGVDRIRETQIELGQRLIEGGRARGLRLHGGDDLRFKTANTAFIVENAAAVEQAMRARGVLPSARGAVIRLAPHFFNTVEDIDRALDLLAELTVR